MHPFSLSFSSHPNHLILTDLSLEGEQDLTMATSQEHLVPTETDSELTKATCEAQDTPEPIQAESAPTVSTSQEPCEAVTGMMERYRIALSCTIHSRDIPPL